MRFEVIMRCVEDGDEFQLATFEAPDADAAVELSAECFEILAAELQATRADKEFGGAEGPYDDQHSSMKG